MVCGGVRGRGGGRVADNEQLTVKRPLQLPPAVGRSTGVVLYKVAQFVGEHLDLALAPWGMKTRHFSVLGALSYAPSSSQQALAEKLRIDPATIVAAVDELERRGLVERKRNARDRRLYDLTITDGGRAMLDDIQANLDAMEDAVFAPLAEAERTQLHGLLMRLLAPSPEE